MLKQRTENISREMTDRFGDHGGPAFFRAPGRVDIMGSHTDYNQGHILASTVNRDIIAGARLRNNGVINLYSLNTDLEVRLNTGRIRFDPEHGWANYAKGVIKELMEMGVDVPGLDLVVHGNVPVGGNLSSSAALEAVVCEAVVDLTEHGLPVWEKSVLCRRAENVFMGMPCGIMDQFTVCTGDRESALMLDCRNLQYRQVSFAMEDLVLVVMDSGKGRELVAGNYSQRVKECREAVAILSCGNPEVKTLRDASLDLIEKKSSELGDVLARRARHVVSEDSRVREAAQALEEKDARKLGEIMEAGYQSSKNDYENSIPELDVLHDLTAGQDGVLGVRICGAGWGGCLLALAEKEKAEQLGEALSGPYNTKTGLNLQTWIVEPSPGAGPLKAR
ncbi:MAG: galactokinase [bacterium]